MNIRTSVAAAVVATVALAGVATGAAARDSGKIKGDAMIGVPSTMTGSLGNIRGVNGGGVAWRIGANEWSLSSSGKLEIEFADLVFAAGPNTGKNTLPEMRAIVSCLDATNGVVNVMTPTFPVSVATATDPGGDGSFEGRVAVPADCFAPIVFVTNALGLGWFAVSGV